MNKQIRTTNPQHTKDLQNKNSMNPMFHTHLLYQDMIVQSKNVVTVIKPFKSFHISNLFDTATCTLSKCKTEI